VDPYYVCYTDFCNAALTEDGPFLF